VRSFCEDGASVADASGWVYSAPGSPWFLVAVAGALVLLLLASRIPLVAGLLSNPRTSALLALPHTLRVLGVVYLILMIQGQLPAVFAVPAALGDIAIGVAAPFLARRLLAVAPPGMRRCASTSSAYSISSWPPASPHWSPHHCWT
jgi:hypothetical protein